MNAYVVFDQDSKKAWIFDTGTDCNSLISFIEEDGLKVDSILLTHTHRDHIYCLEQLKSHFPGVDIFVHKSEQLLGTIPIEENFRTPNGCDSVKCSPYYGHSLGVDLFNGWTTLPCCYCGDALFAGSMGGGMVSYADALRQIVRRL